MKYLTNQKGFTLIELVMVIVILGILAAVAVPKFQDISTKAKEAATLGVVGGVRAGISTVYSSNLLNNATQPQGGYYPEKLDNASSSSKASPMNPFFDIVLDQGGVTKDWSKGSQTSYYFTDAVPADSSYHYNNINGSFTREAGR
ncbi:hypothetical protein DRQ09_04985 [candidate division KSB1 bacterium]|nr:MAG: hypothetical protein DRQ09_04985 [candidate division KSB1 bacterium]